MYYHALSYQYLPCVRASLCPGDGLLCCGTIPVAPTFTHFLRDESWSSTREILIPLSSGWPTCDVFCERRRIGSLRQERLRRKTGLDFCWRTFRSGVNINTGRARQLFFREQLGAVDQEHSALLGDRIQG